MLTSLLIIPILGVLALSPMQDRTPAGGADGTSATRMKRIALLTTLVNFIVSLVL